MQSLLALWFIDGTQASLSASTYLLWYALYAGLFALFYVFSSPFTGNRYGRIRSGRIFAQSAGVRSANAARESRMLMSLAFWLCTCAFAS